MKTLWVGSDKNNRVYCTRISNVDNNLHEIYLLTRYFIVSKDLISMVSLNKNGFKNQTYNYI